MGLRPMAALATILFFSSAAHAASAEELTAAINKCAAITDDGMRHACYDQLPTLVKRPAPVVAAEAPRPAVIQPDAPSAAAIPPKAVPSSEEKGYLSGVFDRFGDVPVPADHITAKVESFTFEYGAFIVTLDNGQVWRQVAARGDLVRLSKDKKDQVTIWRDSFGYDVLKIEGYHTTYHVRRIR